MKKKLGVLTLAITVLLSACSTDLDVIGDWKETMIVYGLLDQTQSKQYIKINKAFLGEGNALEFAQVKDSAQFANALNVTLKRIKNGNEIASYTLTPDHSIPKDAGTFYSGSQGNAIYSFNSTGSNALNSDSQYKLVIRNNETSTEVTSQTGLIGDLGSLASPNPTATVASIVTITPPASSTLWTNQTYQIRFNSSANAREYQVVVRLMYTDSTNTGNVNDSIDWILPAQKTSNLNGLQPMDFSFKVRDYMRYLGSTLGVYSGLQHRVAGNIKIVVCAGSDDLVTYIDVNEPSTGIIQEKPEYTNITNGLGIFSARLKKIAFDQPISGTTRDSLSGGYNTRCLKFLGNNGTWLNPTNLPCR
ncbi:MAG TPA: hypothetical protein VF868_05190 [Bacteroidia bacterium]